MNLDANLCLVAIISILYSICLDLTIFQGDTLTDLIHIVSCQVLIEVNVINLLLQELRVSKSGSQALIEVDGGVQAETAPRLVKAGVDVLVSGSYVFKSTDPYATIHALKELH